MRSIATLFGWMVWSAILLHGQTTNQHVNLAEFGEVRLTGLGAEAGAQDISFLAGENNRKPELVRPDCAIEIAWVHPRAVRSVEVGFEGEAPDVSNVKAEWWQRVWPDTGAGGWMKLDDPFNGQWTSARATAASEGSLVRLTFLPLDKTELPQAKNLGADHRLTYKLRLRFTNSAQVTRVAVFSGAVWKQARLRFEWRKKQDAPADAARHFEMRNGRIREAIRHGHGIFEFAVDYAEARDRLSADRGYVICRNGETGSFAVFVDDVLRERAILVRDIEVLVSDAQHAVNSGIWRGPSGEVWQSGTVMEQVSRMPEQSFERVSKAMPQKPPRYLFLGVPDLRQEIALLPRGQIQLRADSLRSPGADAALRPWDWDDIIFDFGTGEHPAMGPESDRAVSRSLVEGWLPVVKHLWQTGDIHYEQTCVAVPLLGDIASLRSDTGTETVVLATRFELSNTSQQERTAWLWLELSHPVSCRLSVQNLLVLDRPSDGRRRHGFVPVRCRFDTGGRGSLDMAILVPARPGSYRADVRKSGSAREAVRYRVNLGPGERHAIDLFVPYIELLEKQELDALLGLSFTNALESATRFWRERVTRGMRYEVPDAYLNEFFKANLWHVLISTDIDAFTRQHQHGAATHHYKNYLNETAMVARSLEMRGEHEAAGRLIEPFLKNQGVKGLPGNFRSKEGVLYAAHPDEPDPYTAQGYNMHHGFGMWAAAEHFLWTGDIEYMGRIAPGLVAAADWVIRERQSTKLTDAGGRRRVEYGLAPAGDLEDVEEYLYFYATDAYYHLGMKRVGQALAKAADEASETRRESRPPARWVREIRDVAKRLAAETDSFRKDIRTSVAESVATSPVVRLRDGSYIPYVPARAYALTHLKEGWIREALYPALHLVTGEVYEPQHRYVDWMIQDLEDNIFLSAESGYGLADPNAQFFDLGGFTLQPNLLDLPVVYLARDQVPNFLRAFYNTAWASLYPDTMCFAEWVPAFGRGEGPLYKTPDECRFIQWMRHMLIFERGDQLELGLGVPLAWMRNGQRIKVERAATLFGRLDLEIISQAASNRVTANVNFVATTPPKAVWLRIRHPDSRPIRSVKVNGRPAAIDSKRQLIELPARSGEWHVEATF